MRLTLSVVLAVAGLFCLGLPLAAVLMAAAHGDSILDGKDPALEVLLPIAGLLFMKWSRESWRKWRLARAA